MTRGYKELQRVTGGDVMTGGDKELQGVTGGYKRLQGVRGGDKELQRVTKGLQGVTRDYKW